MRTASSFRGHARCCSTVTSLGNRLVSTTREFRGRLLSSASRPARRSVANHNLCPHLWRVSDPTVWGALVTLNRQPRSVTCLDRKRVH
jgi:hypothetical protein